MAGMFVLRPTGMFILRQQACLYCDQQAFLYCDQQAQSTAADIILLRAGPAISVRSIYLIHKFKLSCNSDMQEHDSAKMIKTKVRQISERSSETEIFHKAFLKPLEVALKTWRTEEDKDKQGSLPYGLKLVCKKDMNLNQYILEDIKPIGVRANSSLDYRTLEEQNQNNMISLLKPVEGSGIKVAICVCMYSEDRAMLKKTLTGVQQNIAIFNQKGIASHEIAVFVVMDGIEVVDSSISDYFENLEKENNIYFCGDVDAINPQDLMRDNYQEEEDQVLNINNFIFSKEEEQDRKSRRFVERKLQYQRVKGMIKRIEEMEKDKNLTYDALDDYVKPFFIERARETHRRNYAETEAEANSRTKEWLIEKYAVNIRTSRPIIQEALSEAKRQSLEYISTRDGLALVSPFRVRINVAQNRGRSYEELNEEDSGVSFMNLFMVTKYKNGGKLSSHSWFFNGFCQELKPEFAVLLDVGLAPEPDALVKMVMHMQKKERVGGVCGYMGLKIERVEDEEEVDSETIDCVTSLCMKLFDIQRAQQLEYHFAHLIDKPFEAMFGFIHVLPGAFSAYRMEALRPEHRKDTKLMEKYFASIEDAASGHKIVNYTTLQGILRVILPDFLFFCIYSKLPKNSDEQLLYNENVYLAEDRTLCMGIHQNGFELTYLPDAYAWVDPMKTLYGLLGQRKRWINGSFFAFSAVKEAMNEDGIKNDNCEVGLTLQIWYLTLMNLLGYVAPALFMFTIHIAMQAFQTSIVVPQLYRMGYIDSLDGGELSLIIIYVVDFIYVMMFLGLVFYSMHLTNRHPKFRPFVYGTSTAFGIFAVIVMVVLIVDIISGFVSKDDSFLTQNEMYAKKIAGGISLISALRYIILGIMGLYGVPIFISIVFFRRFDFIVDILFSTPAFIFYSPTYLNVLNIYALCRIDDISWGTKGLDSESGGKTKDLQDNWKKIKIIHVSKMVFWNAVVGFLLLFFANSYVTRFWLTFVVMIILGATLTIKVLIGLIFIIKYKCCCNSSNTQNVRKPPDQVEVAFDNVKESIYKEVEEGISEMSKECKENKIDLAQIILKDGGSMIHKFKCSQERGSQWKNSSIQRNSSVYRQGASRFGQPINGVGEKKFKKDPLLPLLGAIKEQKKKSTGPKMEETMQPISQEEISIGTNEDNTPMRQALPPVQDKKFVKKNILKKQ